MLFTTKTCPNCKAAASVLEKCNVGYTKIDAEENADMTRSFDVRQAPTLVVEKDGKVQTFAGMSEIRKYTDSIK